MNIELNELEFEIITTALSDMIGTFNSGWFDKAIKEAKSSGDNNRAKRLAFCKKTAVALRFRLNLIDD